MDTKRILTFLLCLCSCFLHLSAQQKVQITVLEKGTELPLVSASVEYADDEKFSKHRVLITNTAGQAQLPLPRKDKRYYRVSMLGFAPVKGELTPQSTDFTVHLDEDALGLNRVVITGSRQARKLKDSPVTTQVLSGKALVEAGYADLKQALQQETPGLNIQKVGFGNEMNRVNNMKSELIAALKKINMIKLDCYSQ